MSPCRHLFAGEYYSTVYTKPLKDIIDLVCTCHQHYSDEGTVNPSCLYECTKP